MSQSKQRSGIALPWERRGFWRGEWLLFRRWRVVLASALSLWAVGAIWRAADQRAKTRSTRAAIAEVQRAVAAFRLEVGRCPRSTVELVHPPRSGAQYLTEIPVDGWGKPLYVRCPSARHPNSADVVSAGPTGSFFDDTNLY